jgi:hypothetical protein
MDTEARQALVATARERMADLAEDDFVEREEVVFATARHEPDASTRNP